MIFTVLSGGLGNQMFQYAFAYALAEKTDGKLVFETTELSRDHKRNFALGSFRIDNKIISNSPGNFKGWKRIWNGIPNTIEEIIETKEFKYDSSVFEKKGHLRVQGYWQCPLYFQDKREQLLMKFALRNPGNNFIKWKVEIDKAVSISIHVRRGDYVSEELTNNVHGTCSIEYYQRAIDKIKEKTAALKCMYFIFSDDIEWCKNSFSFLNDTHFTDGLSDAEEMILMSNCTHNIIANSSFSWWAAWLNQNDDKIVVAPEKWFNNKTSDTTDLIPASWIRL